MIMELIAYLNPPDDSGPLSFASDSIVSYRVQDAVSDHAPPLGVVAARRYELTLSGAIALTPALANGARVNVQYKSGAQFLPFGVWYVESLRRDERTGALVLSGCDALGAFGSSPFQDSALLLSLNGFCQLAYHIFIQKYDLNVLGIIDIHCIN